MRPLTWVILAVGTVGLAVVAVWYFTQAKKTALIDRCAALRAELARISTQGGDTSKQNEIRAQLALCDAEMAAAGIAVNTAANALADCKLIQTQIDQEFRHYRSTAYEDLVKRNNARGQVLKLGDTLAQCYTNAAANATSAAEVRAIISEIKFSISQTIARRRCFNSVSALGGSGGGTESGCGRLGLNEPDNLEKSRDEYQRVELPLRQALSAANAKLATFDPVYAKERICRIIDQEIVSARARGDTRSRTLYEQQRVVQGCTA